MRSSPFHCERCGSSNVRRSHRQSAGDGIRKALGGYPLRCHDCEHRFWVSILMLSKIPFAKCPLCLGFTLTSWDPKHYRLSRWRKLMLQLGAHRYRCDRCRFNFASFRPASPQS